MQIKWLEDFVVLSRSTTFLRAAQERNVTHPAFGRRIKALESWVGMPLLERGIHHVELTPAGRIFLASAVEILAVLKDTKAILHEPERQRTRRISIASGRTLSHSVLPALISRVRRIYPRLHVSVTTTSLSYGIDMLVDGKVDMLLCHAHDTLPDRIDTQDYVYHRVGRDRLVAVSAAITGGHPRYRIPRQPGDPVVPFLDFAPSMSMSRILRSRLHSVCIQDRLDLVYESDLAEAIHAMVKEGVGLAWLPFSLVGRDIEAGSLVRADAASSDIEMEIRLYRARKSPKSLLQEIWEHWS